jgi:hypothetical protein
MRLKRPRVEGSDRGHLVRLNAKREQSLPESSESWSVLRTLADKDVRDPIQQAQLIFSALPTEGSLRTRQIFESR